MDRQRVDARHQEEDARLEPKASAPLVPHISRRRLLQAAGATGAGLFAARAALAELSEKHSVPVENIVSPDLVRRIMWSPPEPRDSAAVAEVLRAGGAREWQIELTVDLLTEAVGSA